MASTTELERLVSVARDFSGRGWAPATSGNFSLRDGPDRALVTRSGADGRYLTADDLLSVDFAGRSKGGRPSAETRLHTQLYAHNATIGAVLHVHAPAATVASRLCVENGSIALAGYELLKAFEGINTHDTTVCVPVVPNRQDMAELAALVEPWLKHESCAPIYLIEGHGIYAWGADVRAAARHLEAAEFLLTCHLEERRMRA